MTSCLRTIKAIKNIRRDILDFADATDTFTAPLYEEMLENQLNVRRHLYHVQSAPANYKYEELLLAHKEFIQFHHIFVSHITSIPEKNVTTDLPITTLIDIDRYIYEAMKASIDAHAHTYLTPVEADNYEDTESVDEEKQ